MKYFILWYLNIFFNIAMFFLYDGILLKQNTGIVYNTQYPKI